MPNSLKYLASYEGSLRDQVQSMIEQNRLAQFLLSKYPQPHGITNDKSLRAYVMELKNRYLRKSSPLSVVTYDARIHAVHNALGLHSYVSRVQGGKLKSKHEIRVSAIFKVAPEAFLKMIVVHELAHIKHKNHSRYFWDLVATYLPEYKKIEKIIKTY